MSDAQSHDKQGASEFSPKWVKSLLYMAVGGVAGSLLAGAGEHFSPEQVSGALGVLGVVGGAALKGVGHAVYHVGGHKLVETLFANEAGPHTPTGLNHDIERALCRAAARSIVVLYRQWRNLPTELRNNDEVDWDSKELAESCADYLAGSIAKAPSVIADWLEDLGEQKFLETPEHGYAPWNYSPGTSPPTPPCKFDDWFQWRFPAMFRLEFAEQLVHDDAARRKFQHVIHQRLLDQSALAAVKSEEIRKALEQIARQLSDGNPAWLDQFAGRSLEALRGLAPEIADRVVEKLDPKFAKLARDMADGFARQSADIKEHIDAAIKRLREQLQPAKKQALPWRLQLDRYAIFVINNFGKVELLQALARSEEDSQVSLNEIFVEPELATLREPRSKDFEGTIDERDERHAPDKKPAPKSGTEADALRAEMLGSEAAAGLGPVASRKPACEVLRDEKASLHIVLGDPGSGKSTLLRIIVLRWAEDHLRRGCGREDGPEPAPVPLLTEVRGWLAARDQNAALSLLDYHCRSEHKEYSFDSTDLAGAVEEGRATLLIDGLDEAFVRQTRDDLRSLIRTLAGNHPELRVIVTSRGFNFETAPWRDATLPPHPRDWMFHTVEPFDDPRIERFLHQWHGVGEHEPALREKRKAALRGAILANPHVRRLAVNPMLLTLVCIVVRGGPAEGGTAAGDISRRDLYEEAERLLLHRWDSDRGLPLAEGGAAARLPQLHFADKRSFFLRVASTMADSTEENASSERDSNQISEQSLIGILNEVASKHDPMEVLKILRERNYLLCYRGDATYSFIHRSFLEYFTALNWAEAFTNGDYGDAEALFEAIIRPRWQNPTWHESLRFLISLLKNPIAVKCLDLLADEPPIARDRAVDEPEPEGLVLAAEFVQELSPYVQTGAARPHRPASAGPPPQERRTRKAVVERWKPRLLEYAQSGFSGIHTTSEDDRNRKRLRRRALAALAAANRSDLALLETFLHLIPNRTTSYFIGDYDIGVETGIGWAGGTDARSAIVRAAIGAPPERVGPDADSDVRFRAIAALGSGWAGDAEAKSAILRAAFGVPEMGVAPDTNSDVRFRAIAVLGSGWAGDAEAKSAMLRAAIGVPEQGVAPDADSDVRFQAIEALKLGWAGDAEAKSAFLRVAIGVPEQGVAPDAEGNIREWAAHVLAMGWGADREVREVMEKVRADSRAHEAARESSHFFVKRVKTLNESRAQ